MKNNLSISLVAIAVVFSLAGNVFAFETETFSSESTYGVSAEELALIETDCQEIGTDSGMESEDLVAFIAECIAANTSYNTAESMETSMEEEVYPVDLDDSMMDGEDASFDEGESPLEDATS